MRSKMSKPWTAISLGLLLFTLTACSQPISSDSDNSYVELNKSVAWYNYFPVTEESEIEVNTLYATIDLTLFNDSTTNKTYTTTASISYNNETYPVDFTLIDVVIDQEWDSNVLAQETKRVAVKITQGPTQIEENEIVTIYLTLTDSNGNTFISNSEAIVLYTW